MKNGTPPDASELNSDVDKMSRAIAEGEGTERVEERGSHLASIVDSSDDAIIGKDLNGIITSWNHGAELIFGYTANEMVGTSFLQLIPEDRINEEERFLKTIQQGESLKLFRTECLSKGGRRINVSLTASPIRNASGQTVGISKVIRDITALKQAEEAVLRSEERYRTLVINLDAGVVVHAPDTSIISSNARALELLGLTEDQIKGRMAIDPEWKFIHEDHTSCLVEEYPINKVIAEKKAIKDLCLGIERPDTNEVIWVSVSGVPIFDQQGDIQEIIISFINITERKLAEEEIHKKNSAMKLLVEQLKVASLKAKGATIAKSAFLAAMSHEIRTPLNAIIGMSELLQDDPAGPDTMESLHTINCCGVSLLGLINDILDFSKIEAGQLELEKLPINPKKCAEDAVEIVSLKAHQKGLSLGINIDSLVPEAILGDYLRLRQILVNLLTNAVKFTEQGGVKIEISMEQVAGQGMMRFSVIDSGIGISPEVQQKLFQSFTQADSSISRRYGGTGLGLAISKKLVEWMGGSIRMESSLGKGSTFSFAIPSIRAESSKEEVTSASPPPPVNTILLGEHCPLKILVAEDNLFNQRVLQMMLKRLGYEATFVANGLEAVNATEKTATDLILMDVRMPVMNGLEAAAKICERNPPDSRPYMIALTASAMEGDKQICLAAGMNNYLTKPLHFENLATALEESFAKIKGNIR